ncbi:hypothetical protein [Cereibacter changlensis]|uniref:hypothetical protein n=1 Tax=Cereibacter changlensis TaxID=402884 RepID=UPI0040339CBB
MTWKTGVAAKTHEGPTLISGWSYRTVALRQEELSEFIRASKGEKYSAVVPLLGLSDLEAAAENLRRLPKVIEQESQLQKLRAQIDTATTKRKEVFGSASGEQLRERFDQLRLVYAEPSQNDTCAKSLNDVIANIGNQIDSLDADKKRAAAIGEVALSDLPARLSKLQSVAAEIAAVAEPLIKERLDVLNASAKLAALVKTDAESGFQCPACGRDISVDDFKDHVAYEHERLENAVALYEKYRNAAGDVCDELLRLQTLLRKGDLAIWLSLLPDQLRGGASFLLDLSVSTIRASANGVDAAEIDAQLSPWIGRALEDAKLSPPQVTTLFADLNQARALQDVIDATSTRRIVRRVDALVRLVSALESRVRNEIKVRASETFKSISDDVQRYWNVLQPSEAVTDIRLHVPEEAEKAIEVCLRFHGTELETPRLTLSEGQRNALGLCIFLAMANKERESDRPLILDDVVISFDREHRSRVAALLIQEFLNRQILLLTHDREWFAELQYVLPPGKWSFRRLLPYATPDVGIRFADQALDFEAAKAKAILEPVDALHSVRRVMDVALSEIAERIALPVPHRRGDGNDTRTAGHFLIALARCIGRAYRKRDEGGIYAVDPNASEVLARIKPELAVWANRGTHTFSGSATEATDLIEAAQDLLSLFQCSQCGTGIGTFHSTSSRYECRCGAIQWRSN